MSKLRLMSPLSLAVLFACLNPALDAHAQSAAASAPDATNKAGKPPTDTAASQAGVATKRPSKPGAQSGSPAASAADPATADKAGKVPTDETASKAGVASKKPSKPGAQSGPMPASAPN